MGAQPIFGHGRVQLMIRRWVKHSSNTAALEVQILVSPRFFSNKSIEPCRKHPSFLTPNLWLNLSCVNGMLFPKRQHLTERGHDSDQGTYLFRPSRLPTPFQSAERFLPQASWLGRLGLLNIGSFLCLWGPRCL